MNEFGVLGGNWDPINKKFSSVNSYGQDLLPTCKAFPKETTSKTRYAVGKTAASSMQERAKRGASSEGGGCKGSKGKRQ